MDIRISLRLAVAAAAAFVTSAVLCKAQTIDDVSLFKRQSEKIIPVRARPDTVSLLFLGDIMMHANQISTSEKLSGVKSNVKSGLSSTAFDFSSYFKNIIKDIRNANLAIGNMEFTLGGEPYTGYPAFSAPDSFAEYLANCGFDILLTANNHILDKGKKGYERTMRICDSLKIKYGTMTTGSGANQNQYLRNNPLITEIKGIRIAFANFTYGTNACISGEFPKISRENTEGVKSIIDRAKEYGADYIIALPHWGDEYRLGHSEAQEKTASILAEAGADIIIGSHPHVVQDSLSISIKDSGKNVPVTFSLGNTVSNMSAVNTQTGLMLTIKLTKLENGVTKLISHNYDYLWCSLPGRLTENHTVIKTKDYIGRKDLWIMPYEYDKMLDSYYRVQAKTGIKDRK